jgi:hypothetical protein
LIYKRGFGHSTYYLPLKENVVGRLFDTLQSYVDCKNAETYINFTNNFAFHQCWIYEWLESVPYLKEAKAPIIITCSTETDKNCPWTPESTADSGSSAGKQCGIGAYFNPNLETALKYSRNVNRKSVFLADKYKTTEAELRG